MKHNFHQGRQAVIQGKIAILTHQLKKLMEQQSTIETEIQQLKEMLDD